MSTEEFQYTLRELFLATTLIAIGLEGWLLLLRHPNHSGFFIILFGPICGGMMGAGVFTLFHVKWLGYCFGYVIVWCLVLSW